MNRPFYIFLVLFIILAGCAYTPRPALSPYLGHDTPAGQCAGFFAALDQAVKQSGVRDPGEFWGYTPSPACLSLQVYTDIKVKFTCLSIISRPPAGTKYGMKKIDYAEKPLVLKAPPADPDSARMVVALETRTHYVKSIYKLPREMETAAVRYSLADYDQLRSLKYSGHENRSFFREDSIVNGSERLERYILWPTGVLSPGAMRQWGRHSVAFIGKRHFDDPNLIENIFQRVYLH